jgi:hypothetical protein
VLEVLGIFKYVFRNLAQINEDNFNGIPASDPMVGITNLSKLLQSSLKLTNYPPARISGTGVKEHAEFHKSSIIFWAHTKRLKLISNVP